MLKKNRPFVLLVLNLTAILLLATCSPASESGGGSDDVSIPEAFWGNWLVISGSNSYTEVKISEKRIDRQNFDVLATLNTTNYINISNTVIEYNTTIYGLDFEELGTETHRYERVDNGLLRVTIDSYDNYHYIVYWYKLPNQTVDVEGSVDFIDLPAASSAMRSLAGIGSIDVIIENIDDDDDRTEISNLSDGEEFTAEDLQKGDTYSITVEDSGSDETYGYMEFTPDEDNEDIGTVFATETDYLMKIEYASEGQALYGDGEEYTVSFNVWNYGEQDSPASIAQVSSPTLTLSGTSLNLASISARSASRLSFEVSLNSMSEFRESHEVRVTVIDGNGISWEDHFNLTFYRDFYVLYSLITAVSLDYSTGTKVTIMNSDGQTFSSDYYNDGYRFPKFPDDMFIILPVSHNGFNPQESKANIGIGLNPGLHSAISDAILPEIHEPNNTLETAIPVFENSSFLTYIYGEDVDIFRVVPSTIGKVTGLAATIGSTAGTVELEWQSVSGADGYYIYRCTNTSSINDYEEDDVQKLNDELITDTSFTDIEPNLNSYNYYYVQAVSSTLGYSALSDADFEYIYVSE